MRKLVYFLTAFTPLAMAVPSQAQLADQIAYLSSPSFSVSYEVFIMDANGGNQVALSEDLKIPAGANYDQQLAWSPDGRQLAVSYKESTFGGTDIYIMDVGGSNIVNLTNDTTTKDQAPAWSPDGSQIAFSSVRGDSEDITFGDIYVMDADGTNLRQLTDDPADERSPTWSPDGSQIAFGSNRDGNFEIYVMNADGSDQRRLTNSSRQDWKPDWSPDGTRIAFFSDACFSGCQQQSDIMAMNADGSNVVNLTNNSQQNADPDWSPDGTKILFSGLRGNSINIYVMDADGSNHVNLTRKGGGVNQMAQWRPVPGLSTTLIESVSWGQVKAGIR